MNIIDKIWAPNSQKTKYQSDIMIVRRSDNDYFVSEKIREREVYAKFLEERSYTSNHYGSIEAAREAAENLRNNIIDKSPNCRIIEMDMEDISSANATSIDKCVYDENGRKIFGISVSGKIIPLENNGDDAYKYIDIIKYRGILNERIEQCRASDDGNFYADSGRISGYEFAKYADLKSLYYEIYKATEFVKSMKNEDPELFECDIMYYSAFKTVLNECIEIQKECVLKPSELMLHYIDLTDSVDFSSFGLSNRIPGIGTYRIIIHDPDDLSECKLDNNIYVFCKNKTQDPADTIENYGLTDSHKYTFINVNDKNKLNKKPRDIIIDMYSLGKGNSDYAIDNQWVDSIDNLVPNKNADACKDLTDEPHIQYHNAYSCKLALMYLIYAPTEITSTDVKTLKNIVRRIHKNKLYDLQTFYKYMGEPPADIIADMLTDLTALLDKVRHGVRDDVDVVKNKYYDYFRSLLDNLDYIQRRPEWEKTVIVRK